VLLLTATRTSEVRFSKWADFNLDAAMWVIPEEQTGRKGKKGKRKSHTVPLSDQTVRLLASSQRLAAQILELRLMLLLSANRV